MQAPAADRNHQAQLLLAASTTFYTIIPHKFDINETPPVIDSLIALRAKVIGHHEGPYASSYASDEVQ